MLGSFCLLGGCTLYPEIPALEASFAIIPDDPCYVPCQVVLQNNTPEIEGVALEYEWDFDANLPGSTEKDPAPIVYEQAGTYTLRLSVSGADRIGEKMATPQTITVELPPQDQPVAEFDFSPKDCQAPCEIAFQQESTQAETYEWDFGDGSPLSTEVAPKHTYERPGSYTVQLTAKKSGVSDLHSETVTLDFYQYKQTYPSLMSGPLTGVVQVADGGFFMVGHEGRVLIADKAGTQVSSFLRADPVGAHFVGLVEDPDGNLLTLQNTPNPTCDSLSASGAQLVILNRSGGVRARTPLLANLPGVTAEATGLAVDEQGDYWVGGHLDKGTGQNDKALFLEKLRFDGTILQGERQYIFDQTPLVGAWGGDVYVVPGQGVLMLGEERLPDNSRRTRFIRVNGAGFQEQVLTQAFAPNFVPMPNGNLQLLEGRSVNQNALFRYELVLNSLLNGTEDYANSTRIITTLPKAWAQAIIPNESGGFAGLAFIYSGGFCGERGSAFFVSPGNIVRESGTDEEWYAVIQTTDGGYAFVGQKDGSPLLVKTDPQGQW